MIEAIHCEKPMAMTLADARDMVEVCADNDVQLTFHRQRRFAEPLTEANRLVRDGEIGSLDRIEIGWGDFYDTGAHTIDLATMFTGERRASWVLAGLDYRSADLRFGTHQENQMLAQWRYENGAYALMSTGTGSDFVDAGFVLRGTAGTVRVDADDGPMLELYRDGERESVGVGGETMHSTPADAGRFGTVLHDRAVAEIVDALDADRDTPLSGRNGLKTAEVIFAGYESVRRRRRVDLPAEIDDNPMESMVESGELSPTDTEE